MVDGIRKSNQRWQSDVIVDLIKQYGFPYIALNPGAGYRGLHESLVNYGEDDPPIMLCNLEKIAVQIAHGPDPERAYIGMDLVEPSPDFASIARGLGWWAEGLIDRPEGVAGALQRAIAEVKAGRPALVDTITQYR